MPFETEPKPEPVIEKDQLQRQLGLRDLVLAQILAVVGATWVGTAAALGRAHAVTWISAMLLFYVPMAATVFNLNRALPLEGGIFEWARAAFGDLIGFLVFWNVAGYAVLIAAQVLYTIPTTISYMVGPSANWLPENKMAAFAVSGGVLLALAVATVRGLSLGKWLHNAGGLSHVAAFAVLISLPVWAVFRHQMAHWNPVPFQMPAFNLFFLAIFAQMMFAAQAGLEYVAILAGESKAPARTVSRSVVLASPVICAMFILGTSSVVTIVGSSKVNFISPIPQTIRMALGNSSIASLLVTVAIAMLLISAVGQTSLTLTGLTRLPMVAGWDHLVPKWFMRQHPRWGTPVNSICCCALVIAALLGLSAIGVKAQESNQLLLNGSTIHYGLAYLAMFAIPMVGASALRGKLPAWLPWVAGLGFVSTSFSVAMFTYPFVEVVNPGAYAAKILGVGLLSNSLALGLFLVRGKAPAIRL